MRKRVIALADLFPAGPFKSELVRWCSLLLLLFVTVATALPGQAARSERPRNAGVFVIWYKGQEDPVLKEPYIRGGQVMVQWAEVDQGQGRYDFSQIGSQLTALAKAGQVATVQINGGRKPAWLFEVCPYHPEALHHQVTDKKGTLMYWHPVHTKAYLDMLRAFAAYIKALPARAALLGLRMNFNAVGTEQTGVPENKRALSQWIVPPGAAQGPLWTRELGEEYKAQVLKTYLEVMLPDIYIFTRSQSGLELMKAHEDLLLQGKVGLFHTSSRPEPEDASQIAGRYEIYRQYCRTGHTLGYTEPEKNSWTKNGTPRWCSPPQWNYWRCLCQMDLGVAYVAAYANDVNMAFRGEFNANVKTKYQTGKVPAYQEEFRKAYEFCNVYAGYHALPAISPGAWIAFREGTHMKGDYTMHMSRITPDETSAPPTQTPVGPETSRYGAFARYLPAGKAVRLKLDEVFLKSMQERNELAEVRVIFLDESPGATLTVNVGQSQDKAESNTTTKGSGNWATFVRTVPAKAFTGLSQGEHIMLEAQGGRIPLHMVEVVRKPAQ